ncbi:Uncharacterised protein [Enterobacter hormaechei]|nr:Uncharacterised protein [Enterobacter hormaechei]
MGKLGQRIQRLRPLQPQLQMSVHIIAPMKVAQRGLQRSRVLPQRILATYLKTAKNCGFFHRVACRRFAPGGIMLLDEPVFRINDRHFALYVIA